ncbi:MAG: phosphocholine cytidylyltransferase family protein, partial [Pseudomonadota bacterium]|nr:phosphocholine cytidylyltransferase family protein [Pseudomonadota bacterium]
DSSFVKAIILGAGQGKRLLPLTADIPKALLDVGGHTLIHRQIEALAGAGVREVVVITGYGASVMERELAQCGRARAVSIRTVYNPFFAVADNLASCWMARHEMDGEFLQINGDNVFRDQLVTELLGSSSAHPVTVAVNRKSRYDADDMKVMLDGARLTEIGKMLPAEAVDAEAIGLYAFRGEGVGRYRAALEAAMAEPNGLKQWFPHAVGRLAKEIAVATCDVSGHDWCEIDFPVDLQAARQMVARW